MTFKELRQHVMNNCVLSPLFFGEEVEIASGAGSFTAKVKITHSQSNGRKLQTFENSQTIDEVERIDVVFSKDPDFEGSRAKKPVLAETLRRDPSIDSDSRPFAWKGEIVYEGDVHACYVYERPKRTVASTRR